MSAVHNYLSTLSPASVLCIGPDELGRTWPVRPEVLDNDAALTAQLNRRFNVVLVSRIASSERWNATLHAAVMHLDRGGHLVVVGSSSALGPTFRSDDLTPVAVDATASVFWRGSRFTVHDLLYEARAQIRRVTPDELHDRLGSETPPLVIDTRTPTDRSRFGTIHGAVHVPRTVVEWHFDPANGYLHPSMTSFDQPLVVMCNSGYSSSLSAANLVRIGFTNAADLVGGFEAWRAAGLPVDVPDHCHLDIPSPPDRTNA